MGCTNFLVRTTAETVGHYWASPTVHNPIKTKRVETVASCARLCGQSENTQKALIEFDASGRSESSQAGS
jgi:hypothetical protein